MSVCVRWIPVFLIVGLCQFAVAGPSSPVFFLSKRTEIPAGQSQVIPLRVARAPSEQTELKASVHPKDVIEIVHPPIVLAGETNAYVRVRGLKPGEAKLRIGDRAAISVSVRAAPRWDPAASAPRIVSPAPGACVWGEFAVGVEVPAQVRSVKLRFGNKDSLEPQQETAPNEGLVRLLRFTVDAAKLGTDSVRLVAVAKSPNGEELESEPLMVRVVRPGDSDLVMGECETQLNGSRPERFGKQLPKVGSRPDASGGSFVLNYAAEPAWCLPFEAKAAGAFQVIVVARGDPAMGVFPSVGLYIDDANEATTASQLIDRSWHRVPVGHPVHLDAGSHTLTVFFQNDFHVPEMADRNLYLDRYEVARVDAGSPSAEKTGMASTMMMAPPMKDGALVSSDSDDDAFAVGFSRPLDNQPVTGRLTIEGYCSWEKPELNPPPRVTLVVNGMPMMSQQAAEPYFWLERSCLREGTNTIQMTATLSSGVRASTSPQTVRVIGSVGKDDKRRAFHRFTVRDNGWDDAMKKVLTDKDQAKGHSVACFAANGSATLRLPDELEGTYDVLLEARGEEFKGPPKAAVSLKTDGGEQPVAEIEVSGWWNQRKVGTIPLARGPKQFSVAFTNDLYEEKVGDRNLWLKSVILRETNGALDRRAPRVSLLYPRKKHIAFEADAVVAQAHDDEVLSWVDLVIDGKPQGMNFNSPSGTGLFVFPLLLRTMAPGEHRLSVIVQDPAGNTGESEEIPFTVAAHAPADLGAYARATRLLKRFAFGPEADELAAVLTMGEKAWLADRLGNGFDLPGEQAALDFARARFPEDRNPHQVTQRVMQHLLLTQNPARARFVMWTQNHFSTWIRKTEAKAEWDEHLRFSRLGVARFSDLLMTSATSPAMLIYLDQNRSYANAINENYAREIMELHTLGVKGGYTQRDVTELAALLTGWTTADEANELGAGQPLARVFRFDPSLSDGGKRRVLGASFEECAPGQRYDRVRFALEILASHPSTARFICRKLAEHYVSVPAPERMVSDLSQVFLETGGDMKAVLAAMSAHPDFWKPDLPPRLATPLDYALGVSRACGESNPWMVCDFLQKSGMGLFDRAMPDGYPDEDEAYADSNALMQRWRLTKQAKWALNRLVPDPWHGPRKLEADQWRQNVVDITAIRLTGH